LLHLFQLSDRDVIIFSILQRRIRLVSKVPKFPQLRGTRPGCPARSACSKAQVLKRIAILLPQEGEQALARQREVTGSSGASLHYLSSSLQV